MGLTALAALRAVATLLSGALFGFGLALSGMIQPEVVLSFLRGQDWGLMLVMGGAVAVVVLVYQLLPRWRARPLLDTAFEMRQRPWSRNMLIGSALFGVGWGLCGVCPGPAIAALGVGNLDVLWALAGMAAGALLQGMFAPTDNMG